MVYGSIPVDAAERDGKEEGRVKRERVVVTK